MPKIGWSKPSARVILRSTSPSPTKPTAMTSFMRFVVFQSGFLFNLLHALVGWTFFLTLCFAFNHIDHHFSENLHPTMSLEKLQKVTTTFVNASVKAKWFCWWNSPIPKRIKNMFPSIDPIKEKSLEDWLHRALFWAQVLLNWVLSPLIFFPSFQIANIFLFLVVGRCYQGRVLFVEWYWLEFFRGDPRPCRVC